MRTVRLLRALRTAVDPSLNQLSGDLLGSGGGLAAFAWMPSPCDQIVLRNMLLQHCEIASPIACSVFELAAEIAERLAFPRHRQRSHAPAGMAGNAAIAGGLTKCDILFCVALGAGRAKTSGIVTPYYRPVIVMISALQRMLAGGMTVHAARMRQHSSNLGEDRARALCSIGNRLKLRWCFEGSRTEARGRSLRNCDGNSRCHSQAHCHDPGR